MGKLLDRQLLELRQRVARMAHSVQQSLGAAIAALLDADAEAARIVFAEDRSINEERFALEGDVVTVIATQQPVAGDVRLLIGILEIASELERMGDYAKDIARIAVRQAPHGDPQPPVGMVHMSDQAVNMLERATEALLDDNELLATDVAQQDDDIDNLCRTLHRQLLEQAHAGDQALEQTIRLLPAVHNIERFADRVTNICERIVFIVTGQQIEFEGPGPE